MLDKNVIVTRIEQIDKHFNLDNLCSSASLLKRLPDNQLTK